MSGPSAIHQIKYLLLNQLFTRFITFSLNLLVARQVGPSLYGYATIQLHLPYTIVLYLCREGLRRGGMRYTGKYTLNNHNDNTSKQQYETQNIVNITWLSIMCCIPLIYITLQLFHSTPDELLHCNNVYDIDYTHVIQLYTFSALIELLSEPMYILAQRNIQVQLRVYIDSISVTIRCIVIYIMVQYNYGIYSFVCAQLLYSTCITLLYLINYLRNNSSIRQLIPNRLITTQLSPNHQPNHYIDHELYELCRNFTVQSVEKLILTEGEKMILVHYNTNLNDHGIYSLVSNIGSLVARFVFQPLEESSYSEFSILCNHQNMNYIQASNVLSLLLKFVILVSCTLLCVGPQYSYLFFDILYGVQWSHTLAPSTLNHYFIYIFVISLNGLTESFVFATISAQQLIRYNIYLFVFSTIYIISCIILVQFGVIGLILANCINMSCRIVYSALYINSTVKQHTSTQHTYTMWYNLLPSQPMLVMLMVTYVLTTSSYYYNHIGVDITFKSHPINCIIHIMIGGLSTVLLLITMYKSDRLYVQQFMNVFRSTKQQ